MSAGDVVWFGLFKHFYFREDAVLFVGGETALTEFSDLLRTLSVSRTESSMALNDLALFRSGQATSIVLTVGDAALGMKRLSDSNSFRWFLSSSLAGRFSELVGVVAESESPAHHYLDADSLDDVPVIVSKGEYPVQMFSNG